MENLYIYTNRICSTILGSVASDVAETMPYEISDAHVAVPAPQNSKVEVIEIDPIPEKSEKEDTPVEQPAPSPPPNLPAAPVPQEQIPPAATGPSVSTGVKDVLGFEGAPSRVEQHAVKNAESAKGRPKGSRPGKKANKGKGKGKGGKGKGRKGGKGKGRKGGKGKGRKGGKGKARNSDAKVPGDEGLVTPARKTSRKDQQVSHEKRSKQNKDLEGAKKSKSTPASTPETRASKKRRAVTPPPPKVAVQVEKTFARRRRPPCNPDASKRWEVIRDTFHSSVRNFVPHGSMTKHEARSDDFFLISSYI